MISKSLDLVEECFYPLKVHEISRRTRDFGKISRDYERFY